jgi:glycosyltransferase involved in cell wall biosynthesis
MEIAIHTQFKGMGGSTRLLANLARHLAARHRISFIIRSDGEKDLIDALVGDRTVKYLSLREVSRGTDTGIPDVVLFHLPYGLDRTLALKAERKIALILEIPGERPIVINDRNCRLFDDVIYLSEDQVTHIRPGQTQPRFHMLPIINDVDFEPIFKKTGYVGCVGGKRKNSMRVIRKILGNSPGITGLRVWGNFKGTYPAIARFFRMLPLRHRIAIMGVEHDIRRIYDSFDCLLHTPKHSVGTSMVVNDALACGKLAVLSDLEAFRRSFGGLEGIFFVNDIGYGLDSLLEGYDEDTFVRIRKGYAKQYDRANALALWETVITGETLRDGKDRTPEWEKEGRDETIHSYRCRQFLE